MATKLFRYIRHIETQTTWRVAQSDPIPTDWEEYTPKNLDDCYLCQCAVYERGDGELGHNLQLDGAFVSIRCPISKEDFGRLHGPH